jgi:hypothetical protein
MQEEERIQASQEKSADPAPVRSLIVPKVETVLIHDSYGDVMSGWDDCRLVIQYHQHGAIAHVFRIPPPGHPNEWTDEDFFD